MSVLFSLFFNVRSKVIRQCFAMWQDLLVTQFESLLLGLKSVKAVSV